MKKTTWKPAMADAWVTFVGIGFGQMIYALYVPNHIAPIGFVWGMRGSKDFNIHGCFVEPWARRFGVMSRINRTLLEHFSVVTTAYGSKEGGAKFLKAAGYKRDERLGVFYLERPKKPRKERVQ